MSSLCREKYGINIPKIVALDIFTIVYSLSINMYMLEIAVECAIPLKYNIIYVSIF